MKYLVKDNVVIGTITTGTPCSDHMASVGMVCIELADGAASMGDAIINSQVVKRPSVFHTFDPATQTFVFNLDQAKTEYTTLVNQQARNAIMDVFPDAVKGQAVQDLKTQYLNAINSATTYQDFNNLNITWNV